MNDIGTVAEMRGMFTRSEIAAEITEVQCFKRNLGADSSRYGEELDFCIMSLMREGFTKVKLVKGLID